MLIATIALPIPNVGLSNWHIQFAICARHHFLWRWGGVRLCTLSTFHSLISPALAHDQDENKDYGNEYYGLEHSSRMGGRYPPPQVIVGFQFFSFSLDLC